MGLLENKTCIVTGGAGSIGGETARLFLNEGARVMLVDLDRGRLESIAARLGSERVSYANGNVTRAKDVQDCIAKTVARWGKIDVLFSNAGNLGVIKPIAEFPEQVFDEVLAVHVKGAFLACKYGLPAMNDGGSIIITSSIVGVKGEAGPYAYITAKHAQVGLMRAVAKEAAARRIRVNTLHPGPVDNEFQARVERELSVILGHDATDALNQRIPLRRHAQPLEIARAALFLASDQSSFTTGSTLMVDGGMSA